MDKATFKEDILVSFSRSQRRIKKKAEVMGDLNDPLKNNSCDRL